jgi:hypothetical protein
MSISITWVLLDIQRVVIVDHTLGEWAKADGWLSHTPVSEDRNSFGVLVEIGYPQGVNPT